jgi:hypothetical protein
MEAQLHVILILALDGGWVTSCTLMSLYPEEIEDWIGLQNRTESGEERSITASVGS